MEKATLSELQKENFNLKMKLFHLEEMINNNNNNAAATEEESEVVASLQAQLKERDTVLANAKNIVLALREELQSTSDRLEDAHSKLDDANQTVREQERQIEQLNAALKSKGKGEASSFSDGGDEESKAQIRKTMELQRAMLVEWQTLARRIITRGVASKKKLAVEEEEHGEAMGAAENANLLEKTEQLFTDLVNVEKRNEILRNESALQQTKHLHALKRVEAAESMLNLCAEKMTYLDLTRKHRKKASPNAKSGGIMKRGVGSLHQKDA